jgi:hypothetical protein
MLQFGHRYAVLKREARSDRSIMCESLGSAPRLPGTVEEDLRQGAIGKAAHAADVTNTIKPKLENFVLAPIGKTLTTNCPFHDGSRRFGDWAGRHSFREIGIDLLLDPCQAPSAKLDRCRKFPRLDQPP